MKKVVWLGGTLVLPGYGVAVLGREIMMTEGHANSYISQGLASEWVKERKTKIERVKK